MNKKLILQEMKENLQKAAIFHQRQREYFDTHSIEQMLDDLEKYDICLTEKDILEKYKQYEDANKTISFYFKEYTRQWDVIDNKKEFFCSDIMIKLVDRIVRKNCDIEKLSDPSYIADRMDCIDDLPKNQIQDKIMGIIISIIECAKRNHISHLEGLLEEYDINEFLLYYIKKCHNRDRYFQNIMKEFYETFDDADPRIYKVKGR